MRHYRFRWRAGTGTGPLFQAVVFAAWLPVFLAGSAAAQPVTRTGSLSGHVVDAKTGAPIAKVLVVIESTRLSAQTDEVGRFDLPHVPAGQRRLYVSVVGYILVQRDVQIGAGQSLDILIPLSEGTGTYTEVVTVTGDAFRAAEAAVVAQQVLGSADIQNLRGVLADDPLRAVQVLPGVATGDDLRSEFSVRGSDFGHMNFTVDGFSTPFLLHTVRAVEDRANSGSVAMINSDILEDVTLLNGGYAQRYGNRTGAELDFRLREGSRDRSQARVAISATNAAVVAEGPLGRGGRGSWLASARKSYLDLVVKRLREEGLAFAFTDAQAKFVYDLTTSQRLALSVIAGKSRLIDTDKNFPTSKFIGRNKSAVAIAGWRMTGSHGILNARVLAASNDFENHQTDSPSRDEGDDHQLAARTDGSITWGGATQLEAGADIDRTRESRTRLRNSGGVGRPINDYAGTARRSGAYAQLRWVPAHSLTLVPGARVDHSTLTGTTTGSPWIQGEWAIGRGVSLRGGAGVYRQFPDFEQVIGALGRSSNTEERAAQYDVGVEGRVSASTRWQVTLYDRQEHDVLRRFGSETRIDGNRLVRASSTAQYANRLEGFARGVELLVQRRDPNGLSGWISYAYGRNHYRDTANGESFWGDLDQRHTFNVYAFYRLSDRTSLTGKLRMGSNFPVPGYYIERDGTYFVTDRKNQLRLPVYARLDVRANRTFNWSRKRLTLFAEVMNVLDRDNLRFDPPFIDSRTRQATGLFETMIPIVPSAGVLIEF
jgi:hypothetical protein